MKKLSLKEISVKEMIRKTVVRSGTGGAVWVPIRWLGEKVIIILPNKNGKNKRKMGANTDRMS